MKKANPIRKSAYERQVDAALRPVRQARAALVREAGGTIEGLMRLIEEAHTRHLQNPKRAPARRSPRKAG